MVEHESTTNLAAARRPPKRPPHLVLCILVGAAIGFMLGAALVLAVNERRITGSRDDVFTF
ncbi:MAG: hypothetical protein ACTHNU_02910, partial [Gaiellales bacterium]